MVSVEYTPPGKKGSATETHTTLELIRVENTNTYEATFQAAKEGKYHFRLISPLKPPPEPSKVKEKDDPYEPPSAEADVIRPPGELEQLRMDKEKMQKAATLSGGKFYNLVNAAQLVHDLPSGYRVVLNTEGPPHLLWNHTLCFLLVLGLLTSEWLLRKRKHLL
jgi:hypothetical protein